MMLTIKKRGLDLKVLLFVLAAVSFLTACGPPGPRALVKGQKLLAAGKTPEAIAKFEQAAVLLADSPQVQAQAYNWLGLACHQGAQPDKAVEAYQKALTLDRNLSSAAYNLGCLQLELGHFHESLDKLNTCLGLTRPPEIDETELYLKLGTAFLRLAAQAPAAEKNRHYDGARRNFEAAQKVSYTPEAYNGLGIIALQRSRSPAEAVNRFRDALRLQANYAPAILNLAVVHHFYLNDHRLALQEYRSYVACQPPPANSKDIEAVIRELEREFAPAGTPAPAPSRPIANKPALTDATKATTGSKELVTPRSEPEPVSPASQTIASKLSNNATPTQASRGGSSAANIARYRYALFTVPASGNRQEAGRFLAQGLQAQRAKNSAEALAAFQKAVKTDPSFFDGYYYMGAAMREAGQLSASLEAFEHALSLKPDSAEARYAFAWTLQKAKFPLDSANELEKLLKQNSADVRAHLFLANLYSQELDQPRMARQHYAYVLEAEPQHPQAVAIRSWLAANP